MEIKTEQDMIEFCRQAGGLLAVNLRDSLPSERIEEWERKNQEMIEKGKLGKGSHLQQGIDSVETDNLSQLLQTIEGFDYIPSTQITLTETPYLYPSPKILAENPDLTAAITGCLVNCYDPQTKRFLFHMRGRDISAPFGFQAAAAGMGYFREPLAVTAKKELAEEAGIYYPKTLFNGQATDVLPFMKKGGDKAVPQPLFSFGFANNLSRFSVCKSLDDIAEFEAKTKEALKNKTLEQKEGYHFTIPYSSVEKIAGELNDKKRFYGPIYESTINFVRALRDIKRL